MSAPNSLVFGYVCLLAVILAAYFRSRNPKLGGPVSEGARSFLQDIGLNVFIAVLSANTGPRIIIALVGDTVIWLAPIGIAATLLPVIAAFWTSRSLSPLFLAMSTATEEIGRGTETDEGIPPGCGAHRIRINNQ